MRSTKLLAALSGVFLFAACQEEQLFTTETTTQQMEEVVGAKLIGSDLSLNVGNGGTTRLANGVTTNWDEADQIGLGWIVRSNATTAQTGADPNRDELFANHLFAWNGERFSSIGNFYEGWHFAYYPWSRMKAVGQKQFVVNPAQGAIEDGQDVKVKRLSQALHISHRHFIGADDVNEDNTMKTRFDVQAATNLISVNTTPVAGSTFATGGELATAFAQEGKEVKIKEVVIDLGAGAEVFADKLNLEITHDASTSCLPAWNTALTAAENEKALREALYAETNPVLSVVGSKTSSVTTDVLGAGYFVNEATQLKTIVIPGAISLDWENAAAVAAARAKASIKVTLTNGSFFLIKYVADAEANSSADKNNQEIDKLLKAYTAVAEWDPTKLLGVFNYANNTQVSLNVELYGDIFNTDATFNNIHDLPTWKAACDMATWLKRAEQTFTLTGPVTFENGVIDMPTNGCEVTAEIATGRVAKETMFILGGGEGVSYNEWPATLTSSVWVRVAANTEFNAAHLMDNKTVKVYNDGIINIPEGTAEEHNTVCMSSGGLTNNGVVNVAPYGEIGKVYNHGRIVIEYGAYVYPEGSSTGVIAYEVTNFDINDPSRIIKLTAKAVGGAQTQLASVNTLIVNSGIELDFTKKTTTPGAKPDGDPYAPTGPGSPSDDVADYGNLAEVDFEINGGTIKSTTTAVTIHNVKMVEGVVDGLINIAGDLSNEAGTVNVKAITGAVTTTGDITATSIAGGIVKAENCVINVETIANGIASATGCEINATVSISGNVTAVDCDIVTPSINGEVSLNDGSIETLSVSGATTLNGTTAVTGAEFGSNVTVETGVATLTNVRINGTLTIEEGAEVILVNNSGATSINTIINNGTLKSNCDINVTNVALNPGSWTTLDSDKVTGYDKAIYYTGTYENDNMTLQGKVISYSTVELENAIANVTDGGEVVVHTDVNLDNMNLSKAFTLDLGGNTLTVGNVHWNKSGMVIKNGKINTQVYINSGVDVTFENITFTFAGTHVHEGTLQIAGDAGDVVLDNCTFACGGVWGTKNSRALVVGNGYNKEFTMTGCTFNKPSYEYGYPTIGQSIGANAEFTITNCKFGEIVCFEIDGKESQFSIANNTFKSLDFTLTAAIDAATTTFCESVAASNTFTGEYKIQGWTNGGYLIDNN